MMMTFNGERLISMCYERLLDNQNTYRIFDSASKGGDVLAATSCAKRT